MGPLTACADPERGDPPLENHKAVCFLRNTGMDPHIVVVPINTLVEHRKTDQELQNAASDYSVSTVCLRNVTTMNRNEKEKNNNIRQPLKWKWTGQIYDIWEFPLVLNGSK